MSLCSTELLETLCFIHKSLAKDIIYHSVTGATGKMPW